MSAFPHLQSGEFGVLKHHQVLDLIEAAEKVPEERESTPTIEKTHRLVNLKDLRFVGQVTGTGHNEPNFPLGQMLDWEERGLRGRLFPIDWSRVKQRASGDGDREGFLLVPPLGLFTAVRHENGATRFAYQPAASVVLVQIVSASAGPNATYEVESFDQAYWAEDLTPIDRWATINYQAKPAGALGLLVIQDDTNRSLIAFETPELAPCPAQLAETGGIVDLQGVLGI